MDLGMDHINWDKTPKGIVDCVLRQRDTSNDGVDWRPTETTPEDYYAL